MLCSALSCHKFPGPFKYIKKEQLELGVLRSSLQTNAVLMSSWAKALQSMSNAGSADPGLEEPQRQEGGGSRAPWHCGAVAGKCGRGTWLGDVPWQEGHGSCHLLSAAQALWVLL